MRPVKRLPLLIAALALPITAVLLGYALSNGPRAPQVPAEVRVGDLVGPAPSRPATPPVVATSAPADLPPPEPEDDDDDSDDPDDSPDDPDSPGHPDSPSRPDDDD
ncbi:hypothetical protein [Saccharopolyspora sp. 6V]|uniref:hypothetical protein n=1 Tax=Saccharopolyspora sp. 6V TaxID=2877239 RepID=UPI001CD2D494|nr:hypothetical protein [Saccharopolyspora sp. 6V]MCA1191763.1 hypothetical protein [Saccharopolyspora sp. 6V]